MKHIATCILISVCGFIGLWLLEWRERIELWAGIEPIKWGGSGGND